MPEFVQQLSTTQLAAILLAVIIVALGLFVYGLRDIGKLSLRRMLAVASVARREGIRRKVLWVTPLAMLAVVLLVRLQSPTDESDAIKQALTFGMFASGLITTLITLVLSCTNLPKEIDSKVIFTIVTKPVTRLELVLGKVIGFAQLSLMVLLLMGLFNYGMLKVMQHRLAGRIEARLAAGLENPTRELYLSSLADGGLLRADVWSLPESLNVYAEPPLPEDEFKFILPSLYYVAVPFEIPPEDVAELLTRPGEGEPELQLALTVSSNFKLIPGRFVYETDLPLTIANIDNLPEPRAPAVQIAVHDQNLFTLIPQSRIPANPKRLNKDYNAPILEVTSFDLSAQQTREVARVTAEGPIYFTVFGYSGDYLYGYNDDSIRLHVMPNPIPPGTADPIIRTYLPLKTEHFDTFYRTTLGQRGQGLTGPKENVRGELVPAPYGVLAYRGAAEPDGPAVFEINVDVQRESAFYEDDALVQFEVSVLNRQTGEVTPPQVVAPETGKPVSVEFPAEAVKGGDFDLRVRTLSRDNIISISADRVNYVVGHRPFELNLLMAILVQWLLSVLVVVCGLTFSTLLSWPIALVLVIIVLSGRWVSDSLGVGEDGFGRNFAQQILTDEGNAAAFQTVETGVNTVGQAIALLTSVLPDAGEFDATAELRQSTTVPWMTLGKSTGILLLYGLPLVTLAYVLLRNKEVAP